MRNKIFFKVGWLLILSLVAYLFFVVSFLSPKINTYLINSQIQNEKLQSNKIVDYINNKYTNKVEKSIILNDLKALLPTITIAKTGNLFIVDENGNVLLDLKNQFKSKNISEIKIPQNKKYLFDQIKETSKNNSILKYKWNNNYDPFNFIYEKYTWALYSEKFKLYFITSIYKDDFNEYIQGTNSLILNISILLFILLLIIGTFITVRVIRPIDKIFYNVKKFQDENTLSLKKSDSKDELGFLATQFDSLLNQVENNRKTLEEHVQQKTKEIRNKLYIDDVTSLKNRQALIDDTKDDEFLTITLIDIDSFDDINELYGFSTGNKVLVEVSNILKEFAKKNNLAIYRIYGNVFGLVDRDIMGFSKYDQFINNLSTLFKNQTIHIDDLELDIHIDITLGISIAQEESLKTANIALKKAKKNNRRFFVYNNELDTKEIIEKSMYWREKIKLALNENRVVPFYQPICDKNKDIVKYETLMRIKDKDEKGRDVFLSPHNFFDVAVKTKQYNHLSNQVISKALNDLSKTNKQISLNLSFKDILDRDFVTMFDKNLETIDNKDKKRLVLEILEGDYIHDYEILDEFISKYRNLGIKIAIDDFGTGYSNFSHILKIRPDYIKIDGSLIKNINSDKNSYEMVKSIIEFSKALNIKVIAEYIHNEEVFNHLSNLQVDEFQGYYLGEPKNHIE